MGSHPLSGPLQPPPPGSTTGCNPLIEPPWLAPLGPTAPSERKGCLDDTSGPAARGANPGALIRRLDLCASAMAAMAASLLPDYVFARFGVALERAGPVGNEAVTYIGAVQCDWHSHPRTPVYLDQHGNRHCPRCGRSTLWHQTKAGQVHIRLVVQANAGANETALHHRVGANHPMIAQVLDYDEWSGHHLAVLAYHPRGSLFDLVAVRGRLTEPEVRYYVARTAITLHHLHERHRVHHGSVKAENIVLDSNMRSHLIDFGRAVQHNHPYNLEDYEYLTMDDYGMHEDSDAYLDMRLAIQRDRWQIGELAYHLLFGVSAPTDAHGYSMAVGQLPAEVSVSSAARAFLLRCLATHADNAQLEDPLTMLGDPFFTTGVMPTSIPVSARHQAPIFSTQAPQQRRAALKAIVTEGGF